MFGGITWKHGEKEETKSKICGVHILMWKTILHTTRRHQKLHLQKGFIALVEYQDRTFFLSEK